MFVLNDNKLSVQNHPSSTHPGAKDCPVRSRLMLSMVSGVFQRLHLGHTAEEYHAGSKRDCEEFAKYTIHS